MYKYILVLALVIASISCQTDYERCHAKDSTSKSACNEVTKALETNATYHCCWMEIKDKKEGECHYLEPSKYADYWNKTEESQNIKILSLDCSSSFLYLTSLALVLVLFI